MTETSADQTNQVETRDKPLFWIWGAMKAFLIIFLWLVFSFFSLIVLSGLFVNTILRPMESESGFGLVYILIIIIPLVAIIGSILTFVFWFKSDKRFLFFVLGIISATILSILLLGLFT